MVRVFEPVKKKKVISLNLPTTNDLKRNQHKKNKKTQATQYGKLNERR